MKKLLVIMLCLTFFTGCGNDTNTTNKGDNPSQNNVTDNNANNDQNNNQGTNQNDDWFTRFESGLKGKNVNYTNKTSLDATTIGGAEGYRYATENGNIDVYRYEDGDDFNKIVKDKKLNINGADKNVEINDHYVIVSDGLNDDVMGIFRGLK